MKFTSEARRGIGRRAVLAAAGSTLAFPAIRAQAQTAGVALVIGNSRYQWEAPLPNVRRDAPDIARRFHALGLKTELLHDLGRDAMHQAIDKFKSSSRGANFAAFYFAGHGAFWDRDTYLVPVDADLTDPRVVPTLIPVLSVRVAAEEAAYRLLVYDSGRSNPADGWRQLAALRSANVGVERQRTIAAARTPNTLALFSTAPGRIALDGPAGENSPFAAALLRQLEGRSVDLQTLAPKLRRELLIATEGRQVLWDLNNYQQPFLLSGSSGVPPAGRSAWNYDPSKIVELPNAYAFTQTNGLALPLGLIAHRPANNSPDGSKVGSFKFEVTTRNGERVSMVLVVMSVEEQQTAELILAGRNENGIGWYFRPGTLSGRRLEFVPRDRGPRFVFDWSDANSGSLSLLFDQGRGPRGQAASSTRFTRLDI